MADNFISTLTPVAQANILREAVLSAEELQELPDSALKELGLRLGDVARLRRRKRGRQDQEADDDDDESRARRDVSQRTANTISLIGSGLLADPWQINRLPPKNWAGGVDDVVACWRLLCPQAHPLAWEEAAFLCRVVRQLETVGSPLLEDLRVAVWSRLVVCLGKARFPFAAGEVEKAWETKLVKERECVGEAAVMVRVVLEFMGDEHLWKPKVVTGTTQGAWRGGRGSFRGRGSVAK